MSEPGNLRANIAGHWIGLLLLGAMAAHADDTKDDLTLHGTVVDAATGLPVADADVRHLSLEARYSTNYRDESPPGWSASTDGEGHFTLADLPSRDVYLQVSAAGYAVSDGIRVPPDTSRLDIRLGRGATIDGALSLVSGGPAAGEVGLSRTREGMPMPWKRTSQKADPFGRFRFENVTPGSYKLWAHSSSGIAESRDVRVAEGEHVAIELSLVQLGRVGGWISGLLEGESASISLFHDDESQRHVRSSAQEFDNGRFELHGVEDGAYIAKARAGGRSLSTRTEVINGQGVADFAFAGRSRLTGRVLAGTRPIPMMPVSIAPVNDSMPSAYAVTDKQGRFAFQGLDDGEYEAEVQLGLRGTWRSFPVTLFGETVSDLRLGPYSISGTIGPGFRNNVVQARLVAPGDEPVIHRVFVNRTGTYRFDGLDQGDYLVSHSSPYFGKVVEVRVFGASVEGLNFDPGFRDGHTVPVVDAETKQPVDSIDCAIEEGPWAGDSIGFAESDKLRWLPDTLVNTDMTCSGRGYEPLPVRWDGEPLTLELVPTEAG